MTTSQTRQISVPTDDAPLSDFDIAYCNQRLRNKIFAEVMKAFASEAAAGRISKALIAKRIMKEPAQISRWFSGPGNWTLDTVSSLLLAMGAELKPEVVFLRDGATPNYRHPVAAHVTPLAGKTQQTSSTPSKTMHSLSAPTQSESRAALVL